MKINAIIMLLLFVIFFTSPAHSESAPIKIKATILQCGPRDMVIHACRQDERCCVFVKDIKTAYLTDAEKNITAPSSRHQSAAPYR